MFKFLKSNKKNSNESASSVDQQQQPAKTDEKTGFFANLKAKLGKTRANLTHGIANIIFGKKVIDQALLEDIETVLLTADVGIEATAYIIETLTEKVSRKELASPESLLQQLKTCLTDMLTPCEAPLTIPAQTEPFSILMVGVNGAGKTTTIGKLAHQFKNDGYKVLLAAGDTFRAAAVEQLQAWGKRNDVNVIAQASGADSASVVYDALTAATARNCQVLLADTAGRLHTQHNLMEELKKIKRVMGKINSNAPHEVLLVLDASNGQNALKQAELFHEAIGITGLVLTKLDGTAKGGIVFAIAKQLQIPIRYIGVGESIEDLQPFHAAEFVEALLDVTTE